MDYENKIVVSVVLDLSNSRKGDDFGTTWDPKKVVTCTTFAFRVDYGSKKKKKNFALEYA